MSDSLGDARRALRRGEAGEALVHLWNALEQTRGTGDREPLTRIAALAQVVEERGDEGERAEAERLLEELHEATDLEAESVEEDEEWVLPQGGPAAETERPPRLELPDEPVEADVDELEEEQQPQSRGRSALAWLIPLAIFLFFTLRDVIF